MQADCRLVLTVSVQVRNGEPGVGAHEQIPAPVQGRILRPISLAQDDSPAVQAKEVRPDLHSHPLGNALHHAVQGHVRRLVPGQGNQRIPPKILPYCFVQRQRLPRQLIHREVVYQLRRLVGQHGGAGSRRDLHQKPDCVRLRIWRRRGLRLCLGTARQKHSRQQTT